MPDFVRIVIRESSIADLAAIDTINETAFQVAPRPISWRRCGQPAAIFVPGNPDYGRRFGFSVEKADRFETDYPKSCFMVLDLQPDKLHCLHGKVVYRPHSETSPEAPLSKDER